MPGVDQRDRHVAETIRHRGKVPARDALREDDHVGLDVEALEPNHVPRRRNPDGRVADDVHPERATRLVDALDVARSRRVHPARADHRLEDEGSDVRGAELNEGLFERLDRVVWHLRRRGNERVEPDTVRLDAAEACSEPVAPVIRVGAADDMDPVALAFRMPVEAGELHGGLDRLGAPRDEEDARVGDRRELRKPVGELECGRSREAPKTNSLEPRERFAIASAISLRPDRRSRTRDSCRVEIPSPSIVEDPVALSALDHHLGMRTSASRRGCQSRVSLRVPVTGRSVCQSGPAGQRPAGLTGGLRRRRQCGRWLRLANGGLPWRVQRLADGRSDGDRIIRVAAASRAVSLSSETVAKAVSLSEEAAGTAPSSCLSESWFRAIRRGSSRGGLGDRREEGVSPFPPLTPSRCRAQPTDAFCRARRRRRRGRDGYDERTETSGGTLYTLLYCRPRERFRRSPQDHAHHAERIGWGQETGATSASLHPVGRLGG